jgi:outer membrane protein
LKKKFLIPVLALGAAFAVPAQNPPTKVGVIHVQEALLGTKDGQKAANELQAKFAPKRSELEKKQGDINSLQDQLRKGSATMNDDAKNKLMRDIDGKTTSLKRDSEDFDADVQEEEGKVMQELGAKMMKVLEKYATDNGFGVILDVSNPQTGVLWRAAAVDITADIIALYDKANPATGGAAPSAAPGPATATPRPAAPPRTPAAPTPAPRKQ